MGHYLTTLTHVLLIAAWIPTTSFPIVGKTLNVRWDQKRGRRLTIMELKRPCPFCGNTDMELVNLSPDWFEYAHYTIECRKCEAHGPVIHGDQERAIQAWETRKAKK